MEPARDLESNSRYPTPDLTLLSCNRDFALAASKPGQIGGLLIGSAKGVLTDGRPYWAEIFANRKDVILSIYFSILDLEDALTEELLSYLEREKVLKRLTREFDFTSRTCVRDSFGNFMLGLDITLESGSQRLAEHFLDLDLEG